MRGDTSFGTQSAIRQAEPEERLFEWLNDWLTDWLTHWQGALAGRVVNCRRGRSTGRMRDLWVRTWTSEHRECELRIADCESRVAKRKRNNEQVNLPLINSVNRNAAFHLADPRQRNNELRQLKSSPGDKSNSTAPSFSLFVKSVRSWWINQRRNQYWGG